ncbi:Dihydrolipoyllysine-residue succinyltransferase component of 2-oxoglutarate dehydrogenase complex [Candidatus Arsenophonus lipoptenae]|uniref:Dihydrolipoyllysine-residue succinyltransferase component of 2-oxoglutarate dehydrogenase complex n=2 Tax=Morganellaceae TaxID=1903414 RepID=A0A0X9WAI8_9GAMM|nr:2-oxoglutarate dehydrogenase complex dihydrolipoyllysine-residue succinyltransferase [Candidatus Arsenophonus lipoptenae]AMA64898.1 Dihydrolipoyllysine-residue succinyltransferase component of 2-oxoglutarate dehydrogenase complex [Candidatus Arsenophonus lipoptenae]
MKRIEILVPDLPESVMDAIVVNWHKKPGDQVIRDEILVEIETDKVVLEIPAVDSGVLESIVKKEGAIVLSKELLGYIIANDKVEKTTNIKNIIPPKYNDDINLEKENDNTLTPAVRRLIAKHELNPSNIKGSGIKDRIIPDDVNKHIKDKKNKNILTEQKDNTNIKVSSSVSNRNEKSIPMTPLRRRIAERLLKAKNNAAILTTFNEVNMKPILDLRKQYGESFENRHGIRLGLMSFYVKATVEALKRYPEVNASINDLNIIYHNYFDISIAISTPRGLVTPVLRNVDLMSMAEIEKKIKEFSIKGRDGKLTIDELTGGNFTITNGGVFGSLMSTPIINPPQSGILGMHIIKDRAMVVDGVVKILPMMYLALSYDHRLIDGRESVSFLITIKNMLEDPARLLLDV